MNKKRMAQIIIPVCILVVITGIWFFKNSNPNEKALTNVDFPLNTTSRIDLDELKSHGLPILIDFGADSCIPCKEMAPILKELNYELQGKAIILFVDVWKYPTLADGFPISIIPTQVLINSDGTPYIPSDDLFPSSNFFRGIKKHNSETDEHTFTTHEGGLTKEKMLAMLKEMGMKDVE